MHSDKLSFSACLSTLVHIFTLNLILVLQALYFAAHNNYIIYFKCHTTAALVAALNSYLSINEIAHSYFNTLNSINIKYHSHKGIYSNS